MGRTCPSKGSITAEYQSASLPRACKQATVLGTDQAPPTQHLALESRTSERATSVLHNVTQSFRSPSSRNPIMHLFPPYKPMLIQLRCSTKERASEMPYKLQVSPVCPALVPISVLRGLPCWALNTELVCGRGRFTRVGANPRFTICFQSTSLEILF